MINEDVGLPVSHSPYTELATSLVFSQANRFVLLAKNTVANAILPQI